MQYSFSQKLKAFAGMVVGLLSAIITYIAAEGRVLPSVDPFDTKGWLILVGVAALGYFGVYFPPNAQSQKQVETSLGKLSAVQRTAVLSHWHGESA